MATTIKDIADLAGVSTATVSRVINERGFVKERTRKKISNLIKKHNYVVPEPQNRRGPKLNKSTLMKYRNFTMIWPNGAEGLSSLTGQAMTIGISEAVNSVGATLNIDMVGQGELTKNLQAFKTDGVFLIGRYYNEEFLQKIRELPVIWLLQVGPKEFGDCVQPNHDLAGRMAYQYLSGKGCRKICCVSCRGYKELPEYWQSREKAFRNAAEFGGVECTLIDLDYADSVERSFKEQAAAAGEAVARLKKISGGCDGIFVANNLGFPIYSELLANGIIPAKDIEMVAGDIEVCGGYLNPEPVRIDIHAKAMGQFAFETMMWRLQHPEAPQVVHLQSPSLIIPD